MFLFGAKALEQFVDRLVEWPQYCNHILQISHLRGTHSDLVAFIERALARISSGHSETNGANSTSNDQHQGSTHATLENVEVWFDFTCFMQYVYTNYPKKCNMFVPKILSECFC